MRFSRGHVGLTLPRRINSTTVADIAFICFFSSSLIKTAVAKVFSSIGLIKIAEPVYLAIIYLPILLLLVMFPKKYVKLDFVLMFTGILAFFGLSLVIHPEYAYWYAREDYGVWDYVLYPDEAIYAYLFVRLIDNPKRIIKNMKISGWLMYVYFVYQIYVAGQRGFWYGVSTENAAAEISYNVAFGYNVLIYMLVFLYEAILYRNKWDILGAAIGCYMILTCGSRGPVLFIALFILLMGLIHFQNSRKKWIIVATTISCLLGVYIFYESILYGIMALTSAMNINSRFITMLLDGTVASDNGRNGIWAVAIQMIQEQPLGYGAMGSQHVIADVIAAGYPHSIVLEMLIDFGVFVGGALLCLIGYHSYKMIFGKENRQWNGIFLVYFCTACQLLISMCFWSSTGFWASIAVCVNCYLSKKHMKKASKNKLNKW